MLKPITPQLYTALTAYHSPQKTLNLKPERSEVPHLIFARDI